MRSRLILILLLASAGVSAGILPLIHDRPRRDNPYDPAVKPLDLPMAPVWTPTPTNTATPSCGSADTTGGGIITVGTFESSNDSFSDDLCCTNYIANGAATSAVHCNGAQALCGTAVFNHAGGANFQQTVFKKAYGANQNWAGKTLAAWVRFDPGMQAMSAQLYIKSGGFNYSQGPIVHPPSAGGWVTIAWDLNTTPAFTAAGTNTAQVREVGYQIYSNASDPDGTYSFCLDDIRVQ